MESSRTKRPGETRMIRKEREILCSVCCELWICINLAIYTLDTGAGVGQEMDTRNSAGTGGEVNER